MPETPELKRAMSLWDLVLMNVVAILSIRWLATAARTGPNSITLWALAAVLFFYPQGIAVLFLSVRYPEEGGIYRWARHAFGDFHGFVCGWCYWVQMLVFFPSLLVFAGSASAYALGPRHSALADSTWFGGSVAFALLWIALLLNIRGVDIGKWVQNTGAIALWLPTTLLMGFGIAGYVRAGSANAINPVTLTPHIDIATVGFWATLAFAFAGLELAPIMSGEIRDPVRNVPRALILGGAIIALVYVAGTAAILILIPAADVNIVSGILQTIDLAARHAGFGSIAMLLGILLPVSIVGQTGAWIAGSARIPFVAGLDRFLPPAFGRLHPRWRTPHVALLVQGMLASLFLAMALMGGTVAETYLVLTELAIIPNFIAYLYLFLCPLWLTGPESAEALARVPGGIWNLRVCSVLGIASTILAIVVALIPSAAVTNVWLYETKLIGGTLVLLSSGLLLFWRSTRRTRRVQASEKAGNM